MAWLAVMLVVAAYWALRRKSHALMSLLLAAAAGISGTVLEMRQAQAQGVVVQTFTVVLTSGSSSASVTLPDGLP
ncbi:MAG: hypothetical protein IPP21_08925 [Betaproteobacteria bacterium]|nr:hypothetical protein [Betaproteobacteria bacterium]